MSVNYRRLQISILTLVFIILMFTPTWVILTWAEEPKGLIIQSGIVESSVPAGGVAHLKGYFSAPRGCSVYIFRNVHDSNGVQIGVLNEFAPVTNGPTKSSRDLPIPLTAAPGKAIIYRVVQWACNWPQKLFPRTRSWPNLEFIILEPKEN